MTLKVQSATLIFKIESSPFRSAFFIKGGSPTEHLWDCSLNIGYRIEMASCWMGRPALSVENKDFQPSKPFNLKPFSGEGGNTSFEKPLS